MSEGLAVVLSLTVVAGTAAVDSVTSMLAGEDGLAIVVEVVLMGEGGKLIVVVMMVLGSVVVSTGVIVDVSWVLLFPLLELPAKTDEVRLA